MPGTVDGRDRLHWNVLVSWGGQCVQILSGFILPRLIDHQLGQQDLGVWDFAWSIVSYFSLAQMSVTSSINRYVAMYQARGDLQGLNRVASSVACVMFVMAMLVVVMTMTTSWGMAYLLSEHPVGALLQARWVVLLLGMSMAVEIGSSVFGGVLTGYHRWDLHNAVYAGTYAVMLLGSVIALLLGQGLVGLAAVNLCSETMGRLVRRSLTYWVCPGLKLQRQYVDWGTARSMLGFGTKNFIPQIGQLLLNGVVSAMIIAYMGPAALASYARPRALIRTVITLIQKYAFVFVPTASALQGSGNQDDIRELAIQASRYGAYITLPLILLLTLSGGSLLHVWMGAKYGNVMLIALLTLGYLSYIVFLPLLNILAGLNLHGRPGMANALASCVAIFLVYLVLAYSHAGLLGVALAIGLPLTVANGMYLPLYACRKLGIPLRQFLSKAWSGPIACSIPFGLCLVTAQRLSGDSPGRALVWGVSSGGITLAVCYWLYVVPENWKKRITSPICKFMSRRLYGN